MKKTQITLALLATLFITLSASAQGEWKWAHYWTGKDGTGSGEYHNNVIRTAFDEDGNIYVLGKIGGNLMIDGMLLPFSSDPHVLSKNENSTLLLKYDTLGNMLWYKIVKSSVSMPYPLWMEVKNGNVYISGNFYLDEVDYYGTVNDVWLYYLDTLITGPQVQAIPANQRTPPYKPGRYTYFAKFDTDGNLLENHFVEAFMRLLEPNAEQRAPLCLCEMLIPSEAPFHVDNEGNTYVHTQLFYYGNEEDPYTIQIDGDTNKRYDIYLPGNADFFSDQMQLSTSMIYKFSPNWELLWAKNMVDSTAGIASCVEITGDSVYPRFRSFITGLSFDDEDNMYVSGFFQLPCFWPEAGGYTHQYPVRFWLDSAHTIIMNDISSAEYCNFIVKYNKSGDVLWSNQVFSRAQSYEDFVRVILYGNVVHDNSVFVCGDAENRYNENSIIYFEQNENNILDRSSQNQNVRAFYVQFDKNTGHYIRNSIIPDDELSRFVVHSHAVLTAKNNQLVIAAKIGTTSQNKKIGLARWCTDGSFIDFTPANTYPPELISIGPTAIDDNGNVVIGGSMKGSVNFGDGVVVNGSNEYSNAVFALYHDPEFTQPFVPDDSVGISDYLGRRESDIYIYPNPTSGEAVVCGYMYGYTGIELYDLQGRKLADLVETQNFASLQPAPSSSLPVFDLSPYPAGTYLVKINFERGVSVVRKVVKS